MARRGEVTAGFAYRATNLPCWIQMHQAVPPRAGLTIVAAKERCAACTDFARLWWRLLQRN